MNPDDDPTADIYKLFDEAGMDGGLLTNRVSFIRAITTARVSLAGKLRAYIVRRQHQYYNAGVEAERRRQENRGK